MELITLRSTSIDSEMQLFEIFTPTHPTPLIAFSFIWGMVICKVPTVIISRTLLHHTNHHQHQYQVVQSSHHIQLNAFPWNRNPSSYIIITIIIVFIITRMQWFFIFYFEEINICYDIKSYDMQTEVGRCNFMDAKLHRTWRSEICQVTYNCQVTFTLYRAEF